MYRYAGQTRGVGLRRALTNRLHGILALALCLAASGVCSPEGLVAQDCCTCPTRGIAELSYEAPFNSSLTRLPRNARILVYLGGRRGGPPLLTSGSDDVAFDLIPAAIDLPDTFWLVPRDPLTPGRHYDLSVGYAGTARFWAEDEIDLTPPSISEAVGVGPREGEYCTELVGVALGVPALDEPNVTAEVELLRGADVIAHRFGSGLFATADDPTCFRYHVDGLVEGEELTARGVSRTSPATRASSSRFR